MSAAQKNVFLSELAEGRREPLAVLRCSRVRVCIGYGLAALFGLFGGGLLIIAVSEAISPMDEGPGSWLGWFGLLVAAGVSTLLLDALLLRYVRSTHYRRVLLYPGGFAAVLSSRVQEFPWPRVVEVREFAGYFSSFSPSPSSGEVTGKGVSYQVVRDDGEAFAFDGDMLNANAFRQLKDVVLSEARARGAHLIFVPYPVDD